MITDSWARCRFGATGSGDDDGAAKGVTVEDRASGRTLAEYSQAPAVGLDADALGLLLPAQASS